MVEADGDCVIIRDEVVLMEVARLPHDIAQHRLSELADII